MSTERFSSLANLFSETVLLLDEAGRVLAANRHLPQLGWEAERLVGRFLKEVAVTPPERIEEYLRGCARSCEPVVGTLTIRTPAGEEIVCRCEGTLWRQASTSHAAQLVVKFTSNQIVGRQVYGLNQQITDLTAEIQRRREVEKELWDQREALRVTLASIGDGVIVTDLEGRVTFLNALAETLTGWTQEEAEGQELSRVFHIVDEQTRQPVESLALRCLREGRIADVANRTLLISRDGMERSIDDSAAPIRERDGELLGVVLVFRDVTETRYLEAARNRLAALVESSHDAIVAKSFDGIVTAWNEGAKRLFGYTAEEVMGKPIYATTALPEQKEELLAALERVRQGEHVDHFETIRVSKSGRRIPVSLRISPILNAAGEPVGASAIERDISQQKRHEAMLRFLADASASLARLVDYKSTLQTVARLAVPGFADWCAVDMLDENGVLERVAAAHVDPAQVQVVKDLLHQWPLDSQHPHSVGAVLRTGKPILMTHAPEDWRLMGIVDERHYQVLRSLGFESYIRAPLAGRERVLGVLTFVSSAPDHGYTEADLAVAEDLAYRATIAIENSSLYQEVREANRRKDEFLAMLAHELRNPLAPIRTGLDVLALEGSGDRETIQLMQEQVEHLVRLVDDLLDVSRIIRGRVELRFEPVEAAALIQRTVEATRPSLDQQQQELVVSTPPRPLWLNADPVRLVQVLGNLLNNASKYTERGGRIELSVEQQNGEAVFCVRDNGIGIEPDLLPKIFDLFTQATRSLDRAQGGLGIGLTLVRSLVEMHGGTVSAASEGPGRGSRFIVRLPLAQDAVRQEARPAARAQSRRRRILVVDDNAGAAQMLAMLLATLGAHEVEIAHDGPSGLAKVDQFAPEIVFLDIGLPGMDGYRVGAALRRNPRFDQTVLVALTGYGQEEDRRKSQQAGFDVHLVKPPSLKGIEAVLAHPKLAAG